MADHIVAQFPLTTESGYQNVEIVVAIEHGKPVTYERFIGGPQPAGLGEGRRMTRTFVWRSTGQALGIALSNAGHGRFTEDAEPGTIPLDSYEVE